MMGAMLKSDDHSLTLRVKGGGPAGTVLAVSDGQGNVRGYVEQPIVELAPRADGKLDVGGAVGTAGTLSVVKDLGMKEPYVGQVPLVSGEIAEDITAYYAAQESEIAQLEQNIAAMPSVTRLLRDGATLEAIMERALKGFSPNVLDERAVSYRCDCSQARVERALLSLGRQELREMAQEQKPIEVCCHFCDKKYRVNAGALLAALDAAAGSAGAET